MDVDKKTDKSMKPPTELTPQKSSWENYYEEEIKYLKETEVLTFLNGITNEFHKMLFLFLFETGARASEALQVKLSDINFDNSTVKLATMKRRNKNIVRVLALSCKFARFMGENLHIAWDFPREDVSLRKRDRTSHRSISPRNERNSSHEASKFTL